MTSYHFPLTSRRYDIKDQVGTLNKKVLSLKKYLAKPNKRPTENNKQNKGHKNYYCLNKKYKKFDCNSSCNNTMIITRKFRRKIS